MNNKITSNLISNFIESDWTCSNEKMIYNNDFDLEIKLEDKKTRFEDDIFKDSVYDDVFSEYNSNCICTTNLYYKNVKLDIPAATLVCIGINYIPFPIAANIIDTFYENEFKIAKKFSSSSTTFLYLLKNSKTV